MNDKLSRLIWIDLEMTGLDPLNDQIIEIATLVTDSELNIIATGPNLAIHQEESVLAKMDEWNKTQHGKSGLIKRVQESTVSVEEGEALTLAFLKEYVPLNASPTCGNTVCQDRRFLKRWMPTLEAYFHYRHLDVSTIKELARMWAPAVFKGMNKNGAHLALEDIRESIAELRYYRGHFFKIMEKSGESEGE